MFDLMSDKPPEPHGPDYEHRNRNDHQQHNAKQKYGKDTPVHAGIYPGAQQYQDGTEQNAEIHKQLKEPIETHCHQGRRSRNTIATPQPDHLKWFAAELRSGSDKTDQSPA